MVEDYLFTQRVQNPWISCLHMQVGVLPYTSGLFSSIVPYVPTKPNTEEYLQISNADEKRLDLI